MESLVGYESDDDNETDRYAVHHASGSGSAPGGSRRREDDTNYDDVNMDLSEESQESEPELPQVEHPRRTDSDQSRSRSREHERRDKRRDSPRRDKRERRDERKDERNRSERERSRGYEGGSRRGLLGDRPDNRGGDGKMPALMDIKAHPGESSQKSLDARDAVSPRFVDRDRRDRDRERSERDRERERDRDRHSRRSPDKRSGSNRHTERRSRSRGNYASSGHSSGSSERRGSPPSGDYRPSSYKVNKKLEVMEKMGLQIKTPDGSMATAQQLRAASAPGLPVYYNPAAVNSGKILDQVQKRKLLWSSKKNSETEEAAKWSGAKFAQDADGRQASKFMRLMGIKDAAAVKPENTDKAPDPIKKQEELFQAMQAQYEVARATTHTMRGVGLGFQRSQF